MKVEHITFKGSSVIRDTNDIYPATIEHFKKFQNGSITAPVERTNFVCKVTVDVGIAIFDLIKNNEIFCTNFCCFAKEDKEPVMLYVRDLVKGIYNEDVIIRQPKEDLFIYTIVVNPLVVSAEDSMTAGEIELYVYDAIKIGLK